MSDHTVSPDSVVVYEYISGRKPSAEPHLHRSFEFFMVRKGSALVTVGDETRMLFAGDAMLSPPNREHSMTCIGECEYESCLFSPDLVPLFVKELRAASPESCFFRPRRTVEFVSDGDNTYLTVGFLYSLCGMFFDCVRFTRGSDPQDLPLINRVLKYVEDNYTSSVSLSAAAEKFGVEYKYLSAYFKKNTGMTFNEYVASCRINRAKYLLAGTKTPIADIAADCGYDTFRSFDRNFLKLCSMRPRDYRAMKQP